MRSIRPGVRGLALAEVLRESHVLLLLLAVAVVVYFANGSIVRASDQRAREMLLHRANTIASLIDPAQVHALNTPASPANAEARAALVYELRLAKLAGPDCRFVYLMGLWGDDVVFLADAEEPGSADYSWFGQTYNDATAELVGLFCASSGAGLVEGPVTDSWGTWVSALAPVRDPITGEPLAVLGIDVDAAQWVSALAVNTALSILPYVLLAAALLLILGRRSLIARLEYAATHDLLTGALNRYEFAKHICTWHARPEPEAALFLVDIDNFRSINEAYSHAEGDRILQRVAAAIVSVVGPRGHVARQEGDQFASVVLDCGPQCARELAERIRAAVREQCLAGVDHIVSVSIGVAPLSEAIPFEDSLALADESLRAAKAQGKNRIHQYQIDYQGSLRGRHAAVRLILQGLRENWFELWLQPVETIADRRVAFHEALLRMRHPSGQVLLPAALLPAAHDSGLMPRIDLRAVQLALGILRRSVPTFRLAVNLSGATLADESLLAQLAHSVARSGVDPRRLIFEITESVPLANLPATRSWVAHVREMGCELAIDDFGNGYCSYEYLRELQVQYVKIDGKWIRQAVDNPGARALIRSVSEFARACGARVIAEHVETHEQLALLAAEHIAYAQGYLLGAPAPADSVVGTTATGLGVTATGAIRDLSVVGGLADLGPTGGLGEPS